MTTAKIFMSGNSQAVRLPKEFRFATDEVEITRHGSGILLLPPRSRPERLVESLQELADLIEIPEDLPLQARKGL